MIKIANTIANLTKNPSSLNRVQTENPFPDTRDVTTGRIFINMVEASEIQREENPTMELSKAEKPIVVSTESRKAKIRCLIDSGANTACMTLKLATALEARIRQTDMIIIGLDGKEINVVGETTIKVKCDCNQHCDNPEVTRRCIVFNNLNINMIISLEIALALELITLTCSSSRRDKRPPRGDDRDHEIQALFRAIQELEDTNTEDRFMQEWDSGKQTIEGADKEQLIDEYDSFETAVENMRVPASRPSGKEQ